MSELEVAGHPEPQVMSPDSPHGPPTTVALSAGPVVTRDVPGGLELPVIAIGFRKGSVLAAAMPEAAVFEEAKAEGRHDKIWGAGEITSMRLDHLSWE